MNKLIAFWLIIILLFTGCRAFKEIDFDNGIFNVFEYEIECPMNNIWNIAFKVLKEQGYKIKGKNTNIRVIKIKQKIIDCIDYKEYELNTIFYKPTIPLSIWIYFKYDVTFLMKEVECSGEKTTYLQILINMQGYNDITGWEKLKSKGFIEDEFFELICKDLNI